jgi:hypothetical protein
MEAELKQLQLCLQSVLPEGTEIIGIYPKDHLYYVLINYTRLRGGGYLALTEKEKESALVYEYKFVASYHLNTVVDIGRFPDSFIYKAVSAGLYYPSEEYLFLISTDASNIDLKAPQEILKACRQCYPDSEGDVTDTLETIEGYAEHLDSYLEDLHGSKEEWKDMALVLFSIIDSYRKDADVPEGIRDSIAEDLKNYTLHYKIEGY